MKYNKLIRDNIPEIIAAKGGHSVTHVATAEEYVIKLKEKLGEEVAEYLKDNEVEELADILKVVQALAELEGMTAQQLEDVRQKKSDERGSFSKHLILEES